jgi:eukaryotic-like serine/threonine-protein kinase
MSMIGKTLGHYQITGQLGKGGMGEVFQAKDKVLGRDVAIKILPEEFAKDADRVARFQREAKVLALLNHPNVAAIYGLEESGGTNFLVLELVEGETLADQLKSRPMPVEDSLRLALQMAEALEAAHERGVIHRDLKPANIKITPDGKVKVLDFGLAKAFAGEQPDLNLSNSPTLSNAATRQGIVLGTAAYMSPEQARGKSVDKRADIWAFGCVLFEMLTGRAAFQGKDVTDILAAVIRAEPEWISLPANLHWRLREVLERCLKKDARDRYHDISDVREDIQRVITDPSGALIQPVTAAKSRTKLPAILPWVLAIILVGIGVWFLKPTPPSEPRHVARFYYELPKDQQFVFPYDSILAVSPDGRQFVYSTPGGLYLRSLDELDARLIPGTEGNPQRPFFSPDAKWIGYWSGADSQLKKTSISGGAPVPLAGGTSTGTLHWQGNDTIVYGQQLKGLMRVSANGGTPEVFVKAEKEILIHPQVLPDGKAVLFTSITSQPYKIMVQSLKSGQRKELFQGDTGRYLPSGHIVYGIGTNLFARPFDLDNLSVTGEQVTMAEGVFRMGGALQYAVSDSGTLVYIPMPKDAGSTPFQRTLVWVDRNGKEEPLAAPPNDYADPAISPDGTRVALSFTANGNTDIWIWDLARRTPMRLTFDNAVEINPLWTPDSKRIVYNSVTTNPLGIKVYCKAADGTGKIEPIGPFPNRPPLPSSWADNGKTLVAMLVPDNLLDSLATSSSLPLDIGALSIEDNYKERPLLQEKYDEIQPRISPDGVFMAYTSNESGQNQVYVRTYPDMEGGRWQISTTGGDSPLWSKDGKELYYRTGDAVMAVSVNRKPAFNNETPKILFRGNYVSGGINLPNEIQFNPWDISPDGKRFLMMKEAQPAGPSLGFLRQINVVLNWLEELKQRAPQK